MYFINQLVKQNEEPIIYNEENISLLRLKEY